MKRIMSCGEMLIDFIPSEKGVGLKDVLTFQKMPGGAPANVCIQASKLSIPSTFIGQVGKDPFGDFLIDTLRQNNVDISNVYQTNHAKTALAFVTLTQDGERQFSFYRNPSADQLLNVSQVKDIVLDDTIFHFCSLSLDDYPLKEALHTLIMNHKKHHNLISFDPNLRLSLFSDHSAYQKVITEFIMYADLLKVSDDELAFITRMNQEQDAIEYLFSLGIRYLVITRGKDGVTYIDSKRKLDCEGFHVEVKDTTGAGDSWIGTFLSQLASKDSLDSMSDEDIELMLNYANAAAALTTTEHGAISALPDTKMIEAFLKDNETT